MILFVIIFPVFRCSWVPVFRYSCFPVFLFLCSCCQNAQACMWAGMNTQMCIRGFKFSPLRAIQITLVWRVLWSWQMWILVFDIDLLICDKILHWLTRKQHWNLNGAPFQCWFQLTYGQEGRKRVGLIQKPKWTVALSSSLQSAFICIGLSGPYLAANDISLCEQMFYPEGKLPRQSASPGM